MARPLFRKLRTTHYLGSGTNTAVHAERQTEIAVDLLLVGLFNIANKRVSMNFSFHIVKDQILGRFLEHERGHNFPKSPVAAYQPDSLSISRKKNHIGFPACPIH
jgi:hypothetical protein